MITGKKGAKIKRKVVDVDHPIIWGVGGFTSGLAVGNAMIFLKDLKTGTIVENVHHWIIGVVLTIAGIIGNLTKKLGDSSIFLVTMGLGIMITDLPHAGKQIDNLLDNEPLTKGLTDPPEWVLSSEDLLSRLKELNPNSEFVEIINDIVPT